jgi:hypothetical protein
MAGVGYRVDILGVQDSLWLAGVREIEIDFAPSIMHFDRCTMRE